MNATPPPALLCGLAWVLSCGCAGADNDDSGVQRMPECTSQRVQPTGVWLTCSAVGPCTPDTLAPPSLRIVSWNIKAGLTAGLTAVVDVLRDLAPDVVLLQEVDRDVQRSGDVDQASVIAGALGMTFEHAFASALPLEGGRFGLAVLSNQAFRSVSAVGLSNAATAEPRTGIDARLCLGGGRELRVLDQHADYVREGAIETTLEILASVRDDVADQTLVIGGDFNQVPEDPGPLAYIDAGLLDAVAMFDDRPTFGSRRIDYLFVSPAIGAWLSIGRVIASDASDHAALVLDLVIP